ncbi:MAG: hypothetical protein ABSH09_31570, partial [Bryobacteraceae bacterium]
GLALLGLQGRHKEIGGALDMGRSEWERAQSPLARVWLAIALRAWGDTLPAPKDSPPGNDTMIAALEAIAHPQGNHKLLRTEVSA